jgi:ABC-2 type transport system permease protein
MDRREAAIYDSDAVRLPFLHEMGELVRYRFMLWNLVIRDLRVRYKRSFLGILWAMINPSLTMIVLTVVFMNVFRFEVENYPIYVLSGILLWSIFSRGTSVAMRSMLDNSGILKRIYVPSSVFVASAVIGALIHVLFALAPLAILALITGIKPALTWLFLPLPILLTTLFAFGVALIVAALAVFFADVLDIYEVLLSAYFYFTPIIYPISILPPELARLQTLNPLYLCLNAFRVALINGGLPAPIDLVIATLVALVLTVTGWSIFTRLSHRFAYLT